MIYGNGVDCSSCLSNAQRNDVKTATSALVWTARVESAVPSNSVVSSFLRSESVLGRTSASAFLRDPSLSLSQRADKLLPTVTSHHFVPLPTPPVTPTGLLLACNRPFNVDIPFSHNTILLSCVQSAFSCLLLLSLSHLSRPFLTPSYLLSRPLPKPPNNLSRVVLSRDFSFLYILTALQK